jgi:hypothetical protein
MFTALLGVSVVGMLATETQAASLTISGGGISVTKPKCADGKNNDGVQGIDLVDPDCANSLDNSEAPTTTTASISMLSFSQSISQSTSVLDMGDPRDIDCSAFGKGGGNPDNYDAVVRCAITPLEVSVRCLNNGDGSLSASPKSAHVSSGPVTFFVTLDSGDVTGRGLWAATVVIPGSELLPFLDQLPSNICPNAKNWTVIPATLLITKLDVLIQTFADGILKDVEDLGTCSLNADLETYTCRP